MLTRRHLLGLAAGACAGICATVAIAAQSKTATVTLAIEGMT
jgi:hypothetical protein